VLPYKEIFHILAPKNWSESKDLTEQGVVGQKGERLPANPLILKNAHWFSQLSSFID